MAATDPTAPLVVSDAGPLIHLDELGCLDLLADFASVLVPEAVWREVNIHRPSALTYPEVDLVRVTPSSNPEAAALEALARVLVLHTGELEALRLVLEHRRCLFLTDAPPHDLRLEIWALRCMAPLAFWCAQFVAANEHPSKSWQCSDHCLSNQRCT